MTGGNQPAGHSGWFLEDSMASLGRWLRGLFAGDVESSRAAFDQELSQRVDVESRAEPNRVVDQAFRFAEEKTLPLGCTNDCGNGRETFSFLRSVSLWGKRESRSSLNFSN